MPAKKVKESKGKDNFEYYKICTDNGNRGSSYVFCRDGSEVYISEYLDSQYAMTMDLPTAERKLATIRKNNTRPGLRFWIVDRDGNPVEEKRSDKDFSHDGPKKVTSFGKRSRSDLFRNTIEDFLAKEEKAYKDALEDLYDGPIYTDYCFHDSPEKLTFSYDGEIYEQMNYNDSDDFAGRLFDALEKAGFEWGIDIDQDSYSEISYYKHTESANRKPLFPSIKRKARR